MSGAPDESWREEMRAAFLYRVMARRERDGARAELFRRLAEEAERQAAIWVEGREAPPPFAPDLRARVVGGLVALVGVRPMRTALAAMKVRGLATPGPRAAPHGHRVPRDLSEVGARHRGVGSQGNLRAAVFGVSDGLVSNTALILGVAGAAADGPGVLLAGVAGLVAGAGSMAAGEWLSVRSQRELYEYQIGLERDELARYPAEEAAELALIYRAKGLTAKQANELAAAIIANPEVALDALAREELGLNPDELGQPLGAAVASFASFALGAAVPLAPWLAGFGEPLAATAVLAALFLFAVGAAVSLFSGRGALAGGLRMLGVGGAAGGLTWVIGRALGGAAGL